MITATIGDFESGEGVAAFLGSDRVVPIGVIRERVARGASVETLLFAPGRRVLAHGRKRRGFSGIQRCDVAIRDGGTCSRTGCARPAASCDAHHVQHWSAGGPTDVDNAAHLCRHHHWLIHHAPGDLVMLDGIPHYLPPPGLAAAPQRLGPPPPPQPPSRRRTPPAQ